VVDWKLILQVTFFSSQRPTTDGLEAHSAHALNVLKKKKLVKPVIGLTELTRYFSQH